LAQFGGDIVRVIFREQSKKWSSISLSHVSNVVLVIHDFIRGIINVACPDEVIRASLWTFLSDKLLKRYKTARDHAEFLLKVEFEGRSLTYNPAYQNAVKGAKTALVEHLKNCAISKVSNGDGDTGDNPDWKQAAGGAVGSAKDTVLGLNTKHDDSAAATRREIHNSLKLYYDVAIGRFVDVLCQHVIDHFLLHSRDGPLTVLSSSSVLNMTPHELDDIAGEDMASRGKREQLEKEIGTLKQTNKILRA
jgi:hypothetical protein